MPSGRVHTLINSGAYLLTVAGAAYAAHTDLYTVSVRDAAGFSAAFWAGTLLLSPDLDLAEGQVSSKRAWGPLGFIWVPYGKMFSHRGLSHSWLIGPLTRIGYLALIVWALLYLLRLTVPDLYAALPRSGLPLEWNFWVPILTGYYLSQWLHLIADGIAPDTGFGRLGRKLRANTPFRRKRARRR
ncbi:putative metal-binding protein [Deinobacterium chartae]|uniref:Putative metal-binding protein n=1 Tax=Deinobacterium chartae TaxID=521158 RepID=A0A841I5A9_9DEIO|nr:putative metal-binding protein [Deinobacterium chartae]